MDKILLVDDDRALMAALAIRLSAAGFEVLCCQSADEAAQVAPRERPQLIILDVDMPYYSGLDFQQSLRISRRARDIPVIYLSGHDSESNRRTASEQGAAAFLAKPYDLPVLVNLIRATIERRRMLRPASKA